MDLSCPKCKSENTQKVTSIVSGGTSNGMGTTQAVGVTNVGGKVGLATMSGTTRTSSQTELARSLSCPELKNTSFGIVGWVLVGGLFLLFFISSINIFFKTEDVGKIFALILFVISIGIIILIKKSLNKFEENKEYNEKTYPQLFDFWNKSFYCHRCENIFTIDK